MVPGGGGFARVRAVHPNWAGSLLLSERDGIVVHEDQASRGVYELTAAGLQVHWNDYPTEHFRRVGDVYVSEQLYGAAPDIATLQVGKLAGVPLEIERVSVVVPGANCAVTLRMGSTDLPTFVQTFLMRQYDSPDLPGTAETIVDLGANIGLATVYFGHRYPESRVLAVEPDPANYDLLRQNVSEMGARVSCLRAAAWWQDGVVDLHEEDSDGAPLGAWGVRVGDASGDASAQKTASFNIESMCKLFGLERIDILKVDIEGAEHEVFSQNTEGWIDRVRLLMVETHDRFRSGSEDAVRRAMEGRFTELGRVGENLFFRAM